MASSGLTPVDSECITTFEQLNKKKLKHIIFAIADNKISVVKTSTNPDYAELVQALPANECRWAIYDANFQLSDGGKRQKICFISWIPDIATVNDKFVYANSTAGFLSKLNCTPVMVQATDAEEVGQETLESKLHGKLI